MSMEYIRTMYNVPAKRGGRIRITHCDGTVEYSTITGTNNPHLRVRIDGQKAFSYFSPYLEYRIPLTIGGN